MFNSKTLRKLQVPALLASLFVGGSAGAEGLTYSMGIPVHGISYDLTQPYAQPNLESSATKTYQHKLFVIEMNPNEVQAQRRIVQGWTTAAEPEEKCINANGSIDNSCSWQDWDIDWDFAYDADSWGIVKAYTSEISVRGNSYANWPLFPADEGSYNNNPSFTYTGPKTRYRIEIRFNHPTEGWQYDSESFDLYCNNQPAWTHYSGLTNCQL